MLHTQRRRFPRAPLESPAICTAPACRIDAVVWQVSEGGLFAELPVHDALPRRLAISFDLPGHGAHRVIAEPVWLSRGPPHAIPQATEGAGFVFRDLPMSSRAAMAAYVRQSRQTYARLQFELALDRPTARFAGLVRDAGLAGVESNVLKSHVRRALQRLRVEPAGR